MHSYEALTLFQKQLEKNIVLGKGKTNVYTLPQSFAPKGTGIKIALLKTYLQVQGQTKNNEFRSVRLRVTVSGTAESPKGLELATKMIEKLDNYLSQNQLHLQSSDGTDIPNTRIITTISQEDTFLESPDTTSVQEVRDERTVVITIPNTKE